MRFLVPQNLDVPDTIFLGLNFKQLLYIGGALGFMISLYLFAGGIVPTLLFGGPVAALAGFLSFFSYNNQPFIAILQSLVRFFTRKRMYMWRQSDAGAYMERSLQTDSAAEQVVTPAPRGQSFEKVKEMSTNLVFADEDSDSYSDLDVVI